MDLIEAPRILGVYLSPSGDFSKHISVLKERADTFSLRLQSPKRKISDAPLFHKTIYVPTIRYSLATMVVDKECLKGIQTRLLPSLLQKLGLNSHLPTVIRHGPQLYGGLALCDLQTERGLEAIKFMRNSIFSDTPAGRLIVTNLQHSQREAVIPEPLLEAPDLYLSNLTPTWVTSVRQYLSRHNITITVNNDGTTPPTKGDQHIMQPLHLLRYYAIHQSNRRI